MPGSQATLGRAASYLSIIILFISFLRTLLLPFILVCLREGVYGVSEGGDILIASFE